MEANPRNDREEPTYGLRLHILDIYKSDKCISVLAELVVVIYLLSCVWLPC